VREATPEQLGKFVGPAAAKRVLDHFHPRAETAPLVQISDLLAVKEPEAESIG
jgi:hypothetical protein